jgi:hypothetical protein
MRQTDLFFVSIALCFSSTCPLPYRYVSPSEAVGRNPRFHINLLRIGK